MRTSAIVFLLLFLAQLLSAPAEAQKHPNIELGFNADKQYHFNDLDSVSVFNGNLIIRIPIGPAYNADGSLGYRLTLVYNSKMWDYYGGEVNGVNYLGSEANWRSNAGVGWRLSLGRLLAPSTPSNYYPSSNTRFWIYEGASGDEHTFDGQNDELLGTSDEDQLRLRRISSTERIVEFPNGDRHTFKFERSRWRLREIADRFGNTLSIASDWVIENSSDGTEIGWLLTDSSSRTHRINFQHFSASSQSVDQGQHVSSIVLASIDGEQTYEFQVVAEETDWGCGHHVHPEWDIPDEATLPLLRSITLPDGSAFFFTYYHDAHEGGPCSQGALKAMTVPTGGTTTYEYGHIWLPESFCRASTFGERNPGVKARTTPAGRWEYVQSSSQPVPFDFPQAEEDCGVGVEHPEIPSPQVQQLYRWFRMSVLSPPFSVHNGSAVENRRMRTDSYFYTWPSLYAPDDPWNASETVLPGQPLTTGAPAIADLGPVTTPGPDVQENTNATGETRLSTRVYECPAGLANGACTGGTLLRSTSLRLSLPSGGSTADGDWGYKYEYSPEASRTTYHDDNGCGTSGSEQCWVQTTNSLPDGAGNYRRSQTTTNFPGNKGEFAIFTNYKDFTFAMKWDPATTWIVGTYDRKELSDSTGTAHSAYCFDAATGFLTGTRVMEGAALGPRDVLTLYTPDAKGNLKEERNYGGDVQPLPTTSACAPPASAPQYLIRNAFVDTIVAGVRQRKIQSQYCDPVASTASNCVSVLSRLDVDLHRDSGLPMKSRDVSGNPTTYSYHPNTGGLLASIAPPGAAPTNYEFQRTTFPHSVSISTPATAGETQSLIEYDNVGRVAETVTLLPIEGTAQSSVVATTYDPLGRVATVSEPYLSGSTPAPVTRYEYDVFGRKRRVESPDGSVGGSTYKGIRELKRSSMVATPTGSAEAVVTERYDARQRLIEVEENSGPGGAIVRTTYAYDVAGRLTGVEILGTEHTSPQTRSFTYDKRGFLLRENHPETDAVWYGRYDARGNAGLKALEDPAASPRAVTPHDLRFTYDKAARLIRVDAQEPSVPVESFRPLKEFTFGAANGTHNGVTDWTKGKLVTATRWNYPVDPLGEQDVFTVLERYHYADAAGRKTERETVLSRDSEEFRTVRHDVGYNDLGLPSWIGHPTCSPCTYSRTTGEYPTYSSGRLQSLDRLHVHPNGTAVVPVADLTYWPNGMVKTVTHGNLMVDEITVGSMARPERIRFGPWSRCDKPSNVAINGAPAQVNSGQTVTLTAVSQGTAPFQYEWYVDTGSGWVSVHNAATLTRTVTQTTHFLVRVTNSCNVAESSLPVGVSPTNEMLTTITVSQQCVPPEIEAQPVSSAVAVRGASVTLQVAATGTEQLSYAWYEVDNPSVILGTQRTLTLTSVMQTGVYACKVTNSCGTVTSNPSYVGVALPAPQGLEAKRNGPQSIRLTWTASAGAHHYRVERRELGQGFVAITSNVQGVEHTDTNNVVAGRTYVYRLVALDADGGSVSETSNHDLATMMTFTAVSSGMIMDDDHAQQLLTALASLHAAQGWSVPTWSSILPVGTPAPGSGVIINSVHISTLRARMDAVLRALGVASGPYLDDPVRSRQTLIQAAHITALQQRAQ